MSEPLRLAVSRGSLFGETLELGHSRYALAAAIACAAAPLASAVGNVAIKRSGGALDAVVLATLIPFGLPCENWPTPRPLRADSKMSGSGACRRARPGRRS